jgi:hypothetical protein
VKKSAATISSQCRLRNSFGLQLALVHPPGGGDQHDPEWIKDSGHLVPFIIASARRTMKNRREFRQIQFSDHTGSAVMTSQSPTDKHVVRTLRLA